MSWVESLLMSTKNTKANEAAAASSSHPHVCPTHETSGTCTEVCKTLSGYKIPRISKKRSGEIIASEKTPAEKKVNSKPSPLKSSEPKEMEDDEDQPELGNLSEKQLAEEVQKVTIDGESYAGAVKRAKLDIPFLVYLQKGQAKRDPIARSHYEAFIEFLLNGIMDLPVENAATIKIDWHGFGLGRGIIACLDQVTADAVKLAISNFKVGDLKFRGWLKNEFGARKVFTGFLMGAAWKKKNHVDTIKWIFRLNNIPNANFHLVSWTDTPTGVLVRFEANDELVERIKALNLRLKAGICTLKLKLKEFQGESSDGDKGASSALSKDDVSGNAAAAGSSHE